MDAAEDSLPERPARVRREGLLLAAVLGVALVARVVFALQMRASPFFEAPPLDAGYHLAWARALAAGEPFVAGPYVRAPLYPWLLGASQALLGPSLLVPRLVQALLGTLTAFLAWSVGRRLFGARAGLLAAALVALNGTLIFYDGELLAPTLLAPLLLGAIDLTLRAAQGRRWSPGLAALAGLVLGLAVITRPSALVLAPVLLGWLLFAPPRAGAAGKLLLFLAGLALPIAPVTAHNLRAGDAVLVTSVAGYNLWLGNNARADGVSANAPGLRGDLEGGLADARLVAEREASRALRPSEVSRHFAAKAWAWARDHPADALALFGRKLVLFWTDWEFANNLEPRFFAHRFAPVSRLFVVGFWLLGPLGLLGWCLAARGGAATLPAWGSFAAYALGMCVFFVNARFRAPLLPLLAVLAAHAAIVLFDALRARRRGVVGGGLALVLAVFALGRWQRPPTATSRANGLYMLGLEEARRGQTDRALASLEEARTAWPRFAYVQAALGDLRLRAGDVAGAAEAYEAALALTPDDVAASLGYVEVLLRQDRQGAALLLAERVRDLAPGNARALSTLGRVRYARGEFAAAAAALEEAERLGETHASAGYLLGVSLQQLGREPEALAAFERAAERDDGSDPRTSVEILTRRAFLLGKRGRTDEARAAVREALARFPDHPPLRELARQLGT